MKRRSSTPDSLPSNLPQGETQIALRPEEHSGGCRPSFPRGLFSPTRNVATQLLILSALDGAKLQHPSACQADHLRFTPRQNFGCPLSRESRRLVSFSPAGTYCGDTSVSKHTKSSAAERAGNARALAPRCRCRPSFLRGLYSPPEAWLRNCSSCLRLTVLNSSTRPLAKPTTCASRHARKHCRALVRVKNLATWPTSRSLPHDHKW